jgi:hypothetical protein
MPALFANGSKGFFFFFVKQKKKRKKKELDWCAAWPVCGHSSKHYIIFNNEKYLKRTREKGKRKDCALHRQLSPPAATNCLGSWNSGAIIKTSSLRQGRKRRTFHGLKVSNTVQKRRTVECHLWSPTILGIHFVLGYVSSMRWWSGIVTECGKLYLNLQSSGKGTAGLSRTSLCLHAYQTGRIPVHLGSTNAQLPDAPCVTTT